MRRSDPDIPTSFQGDHTLIVGEIDGEPEAFTVKLMNDLSQVIVLSSKGPIEYSRLSVFIEINGLSKKAVKRIVDTLNVLIQTGQPITKITRKAWLQTLVGEGS